MPAILRDEEERFWEKVDKNGPIPLHRPELGACWVWTAEIVHNGYGRFMLRRRAGRIKAHKWAYQKLVGPVPVGLELDHLCRNPPCVNPAHLEPVTRRENLLRANVLFGHGRTYRKR